MMLKLNVPTERETVLNGVLFRQDEKRTADTVMIVITGIHGNFYSNPFYYNIGETLNKANIDFVYAQTNDAFGQIKTVNVLPMQDGEDIYTPQMLNVIVEEKVPVVTFVGEPDEQLFAKLKLHGIKIVYRSLNPTPQNARHAEQAGADIIVATGFDEGGTLPDKVIGTFSIVPLIADAVKHTPVMAAGGIADHRAFNAALALGAEGVYCGTAFLMSEESRMADNVKLAALKADARDLMLFRTIPAYYRSLPGDLADTLVRMDKAGATNEELGKTMGGFANLRIGMLEGDMDRGYVSLGHGISHIHEIKSAKAIIDELCKDYQA